VAQVLSTIVKKINRTARWNCSRGKQIRKGSSFSFQLSFAKTNQKINKKTERSQPTKSILKHYKRFGCRRRAINQLLIKILLADFGFEVEMAANGKLLLRNFNKIMTLF
jgi:hypothetical protein